MKKTLKRDAEKENSLFLPLVEDFFFIKRNILRTQKSFKILFLWFRVLLWYPFTTPSTYFSTYSTCNSFFSLSILPLTTPPLPRTGSFKDTQNFLMIHEMPLFIHEMQNICFTFLYSTIKLGNRRLNQVGSTGIFLFSSLVFILMECWNLFFWIFTFRNSNMFIV